MYSIYVPKILSHTLNSEKLNVHYYVSNCAVKRVI
jgi:hypothetical protein